jgi:hypothetical protein
MNCLRHGGSKSCGCFNRESVIQRFTKHGKRHSPEYLVFITMHQRCNNPKNRSYLHYGGRGIKVCERWSDFSAFYSDMGPRPSSKHSLERLDNDGDYCPENVIWATLHEQSRNRSNNRWATINGETLVLADWFSRGGISICAFYGRLRRGWTVEDALTVPPRQSKK